jgi:hypothetical protein
MSTYAKWAVGGVAMLGIATTVLTSLLTEPAQTAHVVLTGDSDTCYPTPKGRSFQNVSANEAAFALYSDSKCHDFMALVPRTSPHNGDHSNSVEKPQARP